MHPGVILEAVYSDDDLIEVIASATNGAFAGATSVYVGIGELETAASTLAGFPASPRDVRDLALGAFGREWAGGGVSLRFYCVDGAAHAFVNVRIESHIEHGGVVQTTNLAIPIEPAAVDVFVAEMRKLGESRRGSASLPRAV